MISTFYNSIPTCIPTALHDVLHFCNQRDKRKPTARNINVYQRYNIVKLELKAFHCVAGTCRRQRDRGECDIRDLQATICPGPGGEIVGDKQYRPGNLGPTPCPGHTPNLEGGHRSFMVNVFRSCGLCFVLLPHMEALFWETMGLFLKVLYDLGKF